MATSQMRKLIMLELNEVPYRILDDYCAAKPSSQLATKLPRCRQYTTLSPDEEPLSPWFTWPTVHRGVPDELHEIKEFGQFLDEADRKYPPIWKLLAEAGVQTGVFGPLHSYPLPDRLDGYAFYVPDTFAPTPECHPSSLTPFQNFNLVMARESGRNISTRVDWASAVGFLVRAPFLGLKPRTALRVLQQLASERSDPWKRVRRRTFQSVLGFDLFEKQLKRTCPTFTTFFTNHVASSMHRYWAASYPGDYEDLGFEPDWIERFSREIEYSMDFSDEFFARLVRFADAHPEYLILVTSSMGQKATYSTPVTRQVYVDDLARFMEFAGIAGDEYEQMPAMLPHCNVRVAEHRVEEFAALLKDLSIGGRTTELAQKDGGFVRFNFPAFDLPPEEEFAEVRGERLPLERIGLVNLEIEDEASSTGYHVPEGSLFVYDPQRSIANEGRPEVSTLDIAPAVLSLFGQPIPPYMRAPGAIELD